MTTYAASGTGRFTKPITPAERDALVLRKPVNEYTADDGPEAAELIRIRREAFRRGDFRLMNEAERALRVLDGPDERTDR